MNGKKRVTIRDVAAVAGVSISSVSRYLDDPSRVKPFAAYRIKDAINQLDYVPNTFARNLRQGSSRSIGVVVPNLEFFFAKACKAISDYFFNAGYVTFICESDNDAEKERFFIQQLIEQKVAGLIVASSGLNSAFLQKTVLTFPNLLLIDRAEEVECDIVCEDHEANAYWLMDHMLRTASCQSIELLLGEQAAFNTKLCLQGVTRALEENSFPMEKVHTWYSCRRDGRVAEIMKHISQTLPGIRPAILGFEPDYVEQTVIGLNHLDRNLVQMVDIAGFTMPHTLYKLGMEFPCVMQNSELEGITAAETLLHRLQASSEQAPPPQRIRVKSLYHA